MALIVYVLYCQIFLSHSGANLVSLDVGLNIKKTTDPAPFTFRWTHPFFSTEHTVHKQLKQLAQNCLDFTLEARNMVKGNNSVTVDVVKLSSGHNKDDCQDIQPPSYWQNPTCTSQKSNTDKCEARRNGTLIDGYCSQTCGMCVRGVARTKVFVIAGQHAREPIGVASAIELVRSFCGEGATAPLARQLLHRLDIVVIPNLNPKGRKVMEQSQACKRTNLNGVDLNRNWGDAHRDRSAIGTEQDPGPHGFSEPETALARDILLEFKPHVFIDLHSGKLSMGYPFGYSRVRDAENAEDLANLLALINHKHFQSQIAMGNQAVVGGYECYGCALDYAYEQGVPYAFLFEIYAGFFYRLYSAGEQSSRSVVSDDFNCSVTQFSPSSEEELQSTLDLWTPALVDLLARVDQHRLSRKSSSNLSVAEKHHSKVHAGRFQRLRHKVLASGP